MPKYIVERDIPNAGSLTAEQLQGIAQTSCSTSAKMDTKINWVESYVTDDKVYCVLIAPSEDALREHSEKGGFPVTKISRVTGMIDASTAE